MQLEEAATPMPFEPQSSRKPVSRGVPAVPPLAGERLAGLRAPAPARRSTPPKPERAHSSLVEALRQVPRTSRAALSGAGAIVALVLVIAGVNAMHNGEMYPGVHALGVSLAGLNETDAASRLTASAAQFNESQAAFGANGQTVQTSLADLGVSYDVAASVNDGMRVGRGFFGIGGALRAFHLSSGHVDLPVRVTIDRPTFEATLTRLLDAAGIAPRNAEIAIDGATVSVAPERDGSLPDFAGVEKQVTNALKKRQPLTLNLTLHAVEPSLRASALTAAATLTQQYLQNPLSFSDGARTWKVAPEVVGQHIDVAQVDGVGPTPQLSADFIGSLTAQFAAAINSTPTDAAKGDGGQFGRLIDASLGRTVDVAALTTQLQGAIQGGVHDFSIPVSELQPPQSSDQFLASLGITTLLSAGKSDFSGSAPGRRANVVEAARLINGLLIPPHEMFSYNHGIGDITADPAFVAAGATENGILGTAVGGGVCQVSTTVYRAALLAGMPINEWWPHAFREIYYEQGNWSPGYDAAIQQPDGDPFNGSDLQFTNETDSWMLLRANISGDSLLTVGLYGAPTGYKVEFDAPVTSDIQPVTENPTEEVDSTLSPGTIEQLQPDREGMTVVVTRHVYDASGKNIRNNVLESNYQPQPAIFRVSPDMAGTYGGG